MKHRNIKIIASSTAAFALLSGAYYLQYINQKENTHVHGVGTMQLSCSDAEMSQFEFRINNEKVWTKSHTDLLNMETVIPSQDRRFKGTNVMPLATLINKYKEAQNLEVIACDAKSLTLVPAQLIENPGEYLLGLSRQGRMKLLQPTKQQRYKTALRNVKAINLTR